MLFAHMKILWSHLQYMWLAMEYFYIEVLPLLNALTVQFQFFFFSNFSASAPVTYRTNG